jgi:hypothetical protein
MAIPSAFLGLAPGSESVPAFGFFDPAPDPNPDLFPPPCPLLQFFELQYGTAAPKIHFKSLTFSLRSHRIRQMGRF